MAETTIEWADYTFNPWRGCTKVSPGCANCYADSMSKRNPKTLGVWGPNGTRVVGAESYWKQPLKWDEEARHGELNPATWEVFRPRVFCASLADVFEDWKGHVLDTDGNVMWHRDDKGLVSSGGTTVNLSQGERTATLDDVRRRLFALIDATPNLDWLLVTKRPENIRSKRFWPPVKNQVNLMYRRNVWLLTSVENQEQADKRIPELLKCRDLSPVLGLSCEPLLGDVDLSHRLGTLMPSEHNAPHNFCEQGIDWVIAGGESGPNARPMHPDWVRSLRDQCGAAGVPFFFKQWGEYVPDDGRVINTPWTWIKSDGTEWNSIGTDRTRMLRIGKKLAGRLLDGQEWSEFPRFEPVR